jgi:hypothetical protein
MGSTHGCSDRLLRQAAALSVAMDLAIEALAVL